MQKIIIVLAAILALTATAGIVTYLKVDTQQTEYPQEVLTAWTHWKAKHVKLYSAQAEESHRLKQFNESYNTVIKSNSNPEFTFELELNQFADLSSEEFTNTYLRTIDSDDESKNVETEEESLKLQTSAIPESVDWSTKGAVTDIKDQGQCGSCWAFSTTGSLEGLNFLYFNKLQAFSEQQLVDCDHGSIIPPILPNMGCHGGLMGRALSYTANKGIMLEDDYPYTAKDGSCKYDVKKMTFRNTSWKGVFPCSNDSLKSSIARQPTSVGINASTLRLYSKGVFNDWSCGIMINHGVLAVGYGTDDKLGKYYKVKNSWGHVFGEDGYFRLARKEGAGLGMCGIATRGSYPTIVGFPNGPTSA